MCECVSMNECVYEDMWMYVYYVNVIVMLKCGRNNESKWAHHYKHIGITYNKLDKV